MSRQLRKKLAKDLLELKPPAEDSESETEIRNSGFNAFAAFEVEESIDIQSSEEDLETKVQQHEPIKKSEPNKKSKSKKKKNNNKKEDEDEIDAALKEIEAKMAFSSKSIPVAIKTVQVSSLLVDSRFLDGDNELRKKFGSRTVAEETSGRNTKIKRYILILPKNNWPPFKTGIFLVFI